MKKNKEKIVFYVHRLVKLAFLAVGSALMMMSLFLFLGAFELADRLSMPWHAYIYPGVVVAFSSGFVFYIHSLCRENVQKKKESKDG